MINFSKDFYANHKYLLFLGILVAFILAAPLVIGGTFSRLVFGFLFLLVILAISLNIKASRLTYTFLIFLGLTTIVTGIFQDINLTTELTNIICAEVFFLFVLFFFGKSVFIDRQVNKDRVYGSIGVYLLIGICYAYIYMLLHSVGSSALVFQFNGEPLKDPFNFYYFSFITLTTVGYGDIVAVGGLTRAVVMLESITGLFYLAVLMANISTMLKDIYIRAETDEKEV